MEIVDRPIGVGEKTDGEKQKCGDEDRRPRAAGEIVAAQEKVNEGRARQGSAQMRFEGQQRGGQRGQRNIFAAQGKCQQGGAEQNGEDELSHEETAEDGEEKNGNEK